jgi:hypothetical protein
MINPTRSRLPGRQAIARREDLASAVTALRTAAMITKVLDSAAHGVTADRPGTGSSEMACQATSFLEHVVRRRRDRGHQAGGRPSSHY